MEETLQSGLEESLEAGREVGQEVAGTLSDTASQLKSQLLGGLSLGRLLAAVIVLLLCLLVTRLVLGAVRRGAKRSRLDDTLRGFLVRLLKAFLLMLSVLIAASTLGVDVSSLVAVLGVASLAISLALQGTLSNLVGGVMLLTARPFTLGDFVQIGEHSGTVKAVGLFYTTITTYDNKQIHIPNSTVSGSVITNFTVEPKRLLELTVSASYDSPVEEVKAALREVAEATPGRLPEEAIVAAVNRYDASDINYLLRLWVDSPRFFEAKFYATEQIKAAFDRRGIGMSYPHLNVHLDR